MVLKLNFCAFEMSKKMLKSDVAADEIRSPRKLTVKERIKRLLYLAGDRHITAKYICGREIF